MRAVGSGDMANVDGLTHEQLIARARVAVEQRGRGKDGDAPEHGPIEPTIPDVFPLTRL